MIFRRLAPVTLAAFAVLVLAFGLGGASQGAPLRAGLVSLAALALLVFTIRTMASRPGQSVSRFEAGLLMATALVPLIQLIPLPPALWTLLPGRAVVEDVLSLSGLPQGWMPISLTPDLTLRAALFLIAPAAIFLSARRMSAEDRDTACLIVMIGAAVSMVLGAVQMATGSALYPGANLGSPIGLLSNKNHQATLILAALTLGSGLVMRGGRDRRTPRLIAAGCFTLFAIAILAMLESRAGLLLLAPALLGSLGVIIHRRKLNLGSPGPWVGAGLFAIAGLAIVWFRFDDIVGRFENAGIIDPRFLAAPAIAEAAVDHLPLGSGLGSFNVVYPAVEPLRNVGSAYLNHAHNDYLELWLETGVLGPLLIIAFLGWFCVSSYRAWKSTERSRYSLARAASVALAIILLHALADYPLRTPLMACVFALCCAFLVPPPADAAGTKRVRSRSTGDVRRER